MVIHSMSLKKPIEKSPFQKGALQEEAEVLAPGSLPLYSDVPMDFEDSETGRAKRESTRNIKGAKIGAE
jgi:hypothetical protein